MEGEEDRLLHQERRQETITCGMLGNMMTGEEDSSMIEDNEGK